MVHRSVRAGVSLLIALATSVALSLVSSPAWADTVEHLPTDGSTFVACGYDTVVVNGPADCMSLPDALAAALGPGQNNAQVGRATIDLLPGNYCPISITPPTGNRIYRPITLVGVGPGAYLDDEGPIVQNGPDAGLSTFQWSSAWCGSSAPSSMVDVPDGPTSYLGDLTLRNLTLDGSGAGAPATGVEANEANLSLNDVIVQNFSGTGVHWSGTVNQSSMNVRGSDFLDNGTGVSAYGAYSVRDSTFTGNAVGLQNGYGGNLGNDTIMGNTVGISSSNALASANSIVVDNPAGANTANCQGYGWEATGSGVGASGNNLVDGTSCAAKTGLNADIVPANPITSMQPLGGHGGPTLTIAPPSDAAGHGENGWCGPTDQREAVHIGGASCDIGAYDTGSSATPAVGSYGGDFGDVHVGSTGYSLATVSATNGAVYAGDVTLSGDTSVFHLTDTGNGCSLAALFASGSGSCNLGLSATPTTVGTHTATLTIKTTAGDQSIPLSVDAVPPAPGTLTVTRFDDPEGDGVCFDDYPGYTPDDCSLRQALASIAPGGTITLPAGAYTLDQGQVYVGDGVTLDGAGARTTTITQTGDDRVLEIGGDHATVSGVTITGGSADEGAGVEVGGDATLDHVAVVGNTASEEGGGVYVRGSATIRRSTISGNTVTDDEGAGGGIAADYADLVLEESTVAGNAITGSSAIGGGVASYGGSAEITFSTIANNTIEDDGSGAGIYARAGGGEGEGAKRPRMRAAAGEAPGVTLADTILAGNKAGAGLAACAGDPDVGDAIGSDGYNLADDASCGLSSAAHDQSRVSAQLGALGDHGGPTDTLVPALTSPAVDAASNADCTDSGLTTDQRDHARPATGCDIGSVEAGKATATASFTSFSPAKATIAYGGHKTLSARLVRSGHGVAGASVTLCRRAGHTGAFGDCVSLTTGSTGSATRAVSPASLTQYRWQYAAAGHTTVSPVQTIAVAPKVKASAPGKVARNHVLKVKGAVVPKLKGSSVRLQVKSGHHWKTVPSAKASVGRKGTFVLKTHEHATGRFVFRVEFVGTAKYATAYSASFKVKVTH